MRVARVAGIPIQLHWSFLVLMALYAGFAMYSGGGSVLASTLAMAGVLFGSVILHELGHAMAARAFGVETAHITLYPFGGVAAIAGMPKQPWQELVIAVAGPLVNFALVALLAVAWAVTGWNALLWAGALNLLMGAFNLIPAFPMDGGRVLRAALAGPLGYVPASRIALAVGRVFAWIFVGAGAVTFTPSLLLVGLFLHLAITGERRRLEWAIREAAVRQRRRKVMFSPVPVESAVYAPRWRLSEP